MTDFIGGDFWEDPRYQTESVQVPLLGMTYLNGGEAALRLICADLASQGLREMLLPSYVCPTILNALDRYGFGYAFYAVRENFRIDLVELLKMAPGFKALYVIDYFGYGFTAAETALLKQLKNRGVFIIEDDAQAGFNRASVANVRFNSLRKIVPLDGCFFYSDIDLSGQLARFAGLPNHRLPVIRKYRQMFARLIAEGSENFAELNPLFEDSERHYYADLAVLGDAGERAAAETLDWAAIEAVRKANHRRLHSALSGIPEIEIIFPKVSAHGPPFGFPIYVRSGERDALMAHLREQHVYPVIHWDILKDRRINRLPRTAAMSATIITLLLDQRFGPEDMQYQAGVVRDFFGR